MQFLEPLPFWSPLPGGPLKLEHLVWNAETPGAIRSHGSYGLCRAFQLRNVWGLAQNESVGLLVQNDQGLQCDNSESIKTGHGACVTVQAAYL